MSWTFQDGGGIAPNNAMNRPGEYFVFDFSAYRDTLDARTGRGRDLAVQLPGRAVAPAPDTASSEHLSTRCPPPAAALNRHPPTWIVPIAADVAGADILWAAEPPSRRGVVC